MRRLVWLHELQHGLLGGAGHRQLNAVVRKGCGCRECGMLAIEWACPCPTCLGWEITVRDMRMCAHEQRLARGHMPPILRCHLLPLYIVPLTWSRESQQYEMRLFMCGKPPSLCRGWPQWLERNFPLTTFRAQAEDLQIIHEHLRKTRALEARPENRAQALFPPVVPGIEVPSKYALQHGQHLAWSAFWEVMYDARFLSVPWTHV